MFMPPPQLQTHYDTKHVDIYVYAPPPPNYRHTMTLSMWIFMFMSPSQLQTHYDTKHVDIYVYAPPPPITDTL